MVEVDGRAEAMERGRIRELMGRSPLFSGLAPEDVEALAEVAQLKQLAKGEVLFLEGQPARGFYIVASGRVKVFQLSAQGREQILHVVGPGGSLAEAALFAGGSTGAQSRAESRERTYPASAEALERSTVVFFPREGFARLLASRPELALNLMASLAQKLREFASLIEELSLSSVRGRLARYLLSRLTLSPPPQAGWVELGLTKGALASRLGTVPETLSRTLASLSGEGIIAVAGRRVRVLDVETLREIASGLAE